MVINFDTVLECLEHIPFINNISYLIFRCGAAFVGSVGGGKYKTHKELPSVMTDYILSKGNIQLNYLCTYAILKKIYFFK